MDIVQASTFLVGSILVGLGCIVLVGAIAVINNILARFWRPVDLGSVLPRSMTDQSRRFATDEEMSRIAPQFDKKSVDLSKTK